MRALLVPDRGTAYGQDFLGDAIAMHCGLKKIPSSPDSIGSLNGASLVVSQNPDSIDDASLIGSLSKHISVAIHVHCQYTYYSKEQRESLARCAARARIGVTPAGFATEDMRSRFPDVSWHTVHNGIDAARFLPSSQAQRKTWRRQRGIPEDTPLVAFVGRLERAKGVEVLREFCRMAAGARLEVLIQFLATGNAGVFARYRQVAAELAAIDPDHIHLFPDEDLGSARPIRYCDALFCPSLSEVAPLVALEAFHSGVPVIGTKSTPFYEELPTIGIAKADYCFVDIPTSVNLTLERSKLQFGPDAARKVATRLTEVSTKLRVRTDAERKAASARAGTSDLTLDSMLNRLADVYRNA